MIDKSKFSDIFKEFLNNIKEFENIKECEQKILFTLPENGQFIDVNKFLGIASIIAKEYVQDYIEHKCEILENGIEKTGKYNIVKIPKDKLKSITYILNFKDLNENIFYRTHKYKDDSFDQFMPEAKFVKCELPLTNINTIGNFNSIYARVNTGLYSTQQYMTFNINNDNS